MRKEFALVLIINGCIVLQARAQNTQPDTLQQIIAPASSPTVFVQEGVSLPNEESAPTFMPDGNVVYLADNNTIRFSKLASGRWTKPIVAPFSGQWKDWDPFITPDGKRLIFVSDRPLAGMPQDKPQKNNQLWYVDHLSGDSWSQPRHFDAPVNVNGFNDYAPSVSRSGTLCFCSRGREGNKRMNAYYTKWLGDHYDNPKLLVLNGDNDVFDPYIAPDESYIIFGSNKNLCISYRHGDTWSAGQKLSAQVNNGNFNGGPYVSPDGKMLYYAQDHAPGIMMIPVNIPKNTP
jgi:Tol biopolymer transport system component